MGRKSLTISVLNGYLRVPKILFSQRKPIFEKLDQKGRIPIGPRELLGAMFGTITLAYGNELVRPRRRAEERWHEATSTSPIFSDAQRHLVIL